MPKFKAGEAWKKVFGPVFIYVNSPYDGDDPIKLWDDAKLQVQHYFMSLSIFAHIIIIYIARFSNTSTYKLTDVSGSSKLAL